MERIPEKIIKFLYNHNFVIVSTLDKEGAPHSSCKGVIKINKNGQVFLFDLYKGRTFDNLKNNPAISITAVDEHKFQGYCLKGRALKVNNIGPELKKAWDKRIASRITQRLLRNISGQKGHKAHPESLMPKPEYMIVMKVKEIIDLTPQHLQK